MNRTFKGFLRRYCAELAGVSTSSFRRLCSIARSNARLVEPLFLFAAEQGKMKYLVGLSEGAWFHDEYAKLAGQIDRSGSARAFLESGGAPKRYAAVLDAFEAQGDHLAADRRMNGLMRPRIIASLQESGMTRYQLCRALGLNAGNVYAYLAGDDAKVSNKTAHYILDYLTGERT